MKKIVLGLMSMSLVLVASSNLSAQENGYGRTVSTSEVSSTKATGRTISRSETVNIASADFAKKHKNASEVTWNSAGETISVSFVEDGTSTRCTYDTKGKLEYTIRYLKGSKIPGYIFNEVKKNNYFMNVNQVIEVKRRNTVSHFVKMEDKHSFVTLLIQNGETQVYETITKA